MENTTLARKPGTMDAKTVALDGYRGLMTGKTLVIPGMLNWLVAESVRFAPRKVVTGISKRLLERRV
jgi:short-subunit dehydrogenase